MPAQQMTRADAQQRASLAAKLRVEGRTWEQIAETCGFLDASNAHRSVRSFYADMPQPDVDDARREVWERTQWLWGKAVEDIEEGKPGAITAGVRVLERFSKLSGIDAPSRLEVGHVEAFFGSLYAPSEDEEEIAMPSLPEMIELPAGE
jgi:hypothetical protein